jgi:two-component system CheB/CheR fusion protein
MPKKVKSPDKNSKHTFPIVGIGASAGGLSVFQTFFTAMPPTSESGMAFVLVQHLAARPYQYARRADSTAY